MSLQIIFEWQLLASGNAIAARVTAGFHIFVMSHLLRPCKDFIKKQSVSTVTLWAYQDDCSEWET